MTTREGRGIAATSATPCRTSSWTSRGDEEGKEGGKGKRDLHHDDYRLSLSLLSRKVPTCGRERTRGRGEEGRVVTTHRERQEIPSGG